ASDCKKETAPTLEPCHCCGFLILVSLEKGRRTRHFHLATRVENEGRGEPGASKSKRSLVQPALSLSPQGRAPAELIFL
ncbi:MAG TPA: hypothetical protein VN903_10650, partial [Polyangia bacterium]|nr:hypothetical protein [Polyangia bacterium]